MRWSGTDRPVLVIGYGNSLRRDDGAGLILASALVDAWTQQGLPASLITVRQLSPELADDIAGSGAFIVLFVDATDSAAGAAIEATPIPWRAAPQSPSPSLGHHLTPAAVMLYAGELFGFRGCGWIISIPGYDFDHGEGLSAQTQVLVDGFVRDGSALWQQLQASYTP